MAAYEAISISSDLLKKLDSRNRIHFLRIFDRLSRSSVFLQDIYLAVCGLRHALCVGLTCLAHRFPFCIDHAAIRALRWMTSVSNMRACCEMYPQHLFAFCKRAFIVHCLEGEQQAPCVSLWQITQPRQPSFHRQI